jgi:hypothetical protein
MTIARPLQDYRGLVETCRQRADELSLSRLELDRLAGLPEGYSGKLLGSGKGLKPKRMWPASLEAILGTLGLKLIVVEDETAAARTLTRREPVQQHQQRYGDYGRGPRRLALLPPTAAPPALTIVQGSRKRRAAKYG